MEQSLALLEAARQSRLNAYVVLSLAVGIRTEEARELHWDHIDLDGDPGAARPVPPSVAVWRSVREGGDTKTAKSRRTLALPQAAVQAPREHRKRQAQDRLAALGPLVLVNGLAPCGRETATTTVPPRVPRRSTQTPTISRSAIRARGAGWRRSRLS